MTELSIVIPVFNDCKVLQELYRRLEPVVSKVGKSYEIIFVDDGSSDDSFQILKELQDKDENIRIVKLVKNFGQSNAITAGLEYSKGDIIVIMDSDLQDKPEDIPILLNALEENDVQMVVAKWVSRKGPVVKKIISNTFFRVSNIITKIHHPPNIGVFRAFKKGAYETVKNIPELSGTTLSRFYRAEINYKTVDLHRDKRYAGKGGYNLNRMFKLAFDRILPHARFKIAKRDPEFTVERFMAKKESTNE
ncbi:MAG: glycosyltransferase family 2 protein [Armatimonadetes bacterium]|nr:glycosyltransferase family 2 protein [Armatimonadota bacterium]